MTRRSLIVAAFVLVCLLDAVCARSGAASAAPASAPAPAPKHLLQYGCRQLAIESGDATLPALVCVPVLDGKPASVVWRVYDMNGKKLDESQPAPTGTFLEFPGGQLIEMEAKASDGAIVRGRLVLEWKRLPNGFLMEVDGPYTEDVLRALGEWTPERGETLRKFQQDNGIAAPLKRPGAAPGTQT